MLVLAAACALAAPAAAGSLPLTARLANALAVRGVSSAQSGAVAVDLTTGSVLFARHPDLSLAPASNEKLVVTFAALKELGPLYRFTTAVEGSGEQVGTEWRGTIYLKGYGDPTLDGLHLKRLVNQLAHLGIRSISGRILADESWFDSVRTAPGWKAGFYINECSPLSALVANGGVYEGHVALSPAVAAAGLFRKLLRVRGISSGSVGTGVAPRTADVLAVTQSATLQSIVADMDRVSDNFAAEMLLKDLGAQIGSRGTTAAGAAVVRASLAKAEVPLAGVRIVDGSGLSLLDRLTAGAIAALLVDAWNDPDLRGPFWHALPVAGETGTLEHRMERRPARGAVHAKTGTTNEASALSGFVSTRYAFAILQNGSPVNDTAARKAQDRFATALAAE
jgi:serine-type D-Ala-D-Ala carboxypeptidase/endopeptidase (penicillin-binding protein 4)